MDTLTVDKGKALGNTGAFAVSIGGYKMNIKEILEASKRLDNLTSANDVLKELNIVLTSVNESKKPEEKENETDTNR